MVFSLKEVPELDHSIAELADVSRGWCAWRNGPTEGWRRALKARESTALIPMRAVAMGDCNSPIPEA